MVEHGQRHERPNTSPSPMTRRAVVCWTTKLAAGALVAAIPVGHLVQTARADDDADGDVVILKAAGAQVSASPGSRRLDPRRLRLSLPRRGARPGCRRPGPGQWRRGRHARALLPSPRPPPIKGQSRKVRPPSHPRRVRIMLSKRRGQRRGSLLQRLPVAVEVEKAAGAVEVEQAAGAAEAVDAVLAEAVVAAVIAFEAVAEPRAPGSAVRESAVASRPRLCRRQASATWILVRCPSLFAIASAAAALGAVVFRDRGQTALTAEAVIGHR